MTKITALFTKLPKWRLKYVHKMIRRIFCAKKKLTSLDNDCLEKIFKYLTLKDLLNVADSNKRLKQVADTVFTLNHGKKQLNLIDFNSILGSNLIISSAEIYVGDLKTSLQMLRCFGHSISRVLINRNGNTNDSNARYSTIRETLLIYVNVFCTKSLTDIEIIGDDKLRINQLENSFTNIERVQIWNCELTKETQLNHLFPNVRCMYLYGIRITDWNSIECHFPVLDDLKVYGIWMNGIEYDIFNSKYCATILKLNPQLKMVNDSAVPHVCLLFDISFNGDDSMRSI